MRSKKATSSDLKFERPKWYSEIIKEVSSLRSKDREFHGLEREFMNFQAQILLDYEKTRDLKHPRDLGNARESILRDFLKNSGLLPKKYSVSETSARVISYSGHSSNEMDIVIYDTNQSIILMRRQNIFEAYPIESVFGVVQVKSRLTKKELISGLKNISTFKSLSDTSNSGFGFLFAYESEIIWPDIITEMNLFANSNPKNFWCNGIFILNQGCLLYGDNSQAMRLNSEIEKLLQPEVYGIPDDSGSCLATFYSILRDNLDATKTYDVDFRKYYRLPLTVAHYSYEFEYGAAMESAKCEKHGPYQRKISQEALEKILDFAKNTTSISPLSALAVAHGEKADVVESHSRSSVRIYNPELLHLSQILVANVTNFLTYDSIKCQEIIIWIPHYYSQKEEIINSCPKCKSQSKRLKIKKEE
jgi:hypothetical protein